jgi:hypothetical protein
LTLNDAVTDGTYLVDFSFSFNGPTGKEFRAGVFVNGTFQSNIVTHQSTPFDSTDYNITGNGVLQLVNGDVVDLRFKSVDAGNTINIQTGNFRIAKLDASQGPTGPQGLLWRGAWNSGTSYNVSDGVSLDGSSYICIQAHTNQTPPNATYWNILASKGDTGTGGGGGSGKIAYTLFTHKAVATLDSYQSIGNWTWNHSRYSGYTNGILVYYAEVPDSTYRLQVRFRDITNNVTLGESVELTASGFYTLSLTNPGANAHVQLQVRKSVAGGTSPSIYGVTLEYDT